MSSVPPNDPSPAKTVKNYSNAENVEKKNQNIENTQKSKLISSHLLGSRVKPERAELDKMLVAFFIKFAKLRVHTTVLMQETRKKIILLSRDSKMFVKKQAISIIENTKQTKSLFSPSMFTKLMSIMKNIPYIGKSFKPGSTMSSTPSRPMKYPYTYSAKIAQFPYKFYFNNNWLYRYYGLALIVSFPLFYKLGRASNSPENVKKWEEIRKRDFGLVPHSH